MIDPNAEREDTRAALTDPAYIDAFELYRNGRALEWTARQQEAVARVRELTGNVGPGLPMPLGPA